MADVTSETTSPKPHWLTDMNWRANAVLLLFASVFGFSSGTLAPKGTAQGLSQDQADVRYLTKEEANRRGDVRDRQFEEIKKAMVTNAIFDERTNMILKQIEMMRQEQKEDRAAMERMLANR